MRRRAGSAGDRLPTCPHLELACGREGTSPAAPEPPAVPCTTEATTPQRANEAASAQSGHCVSCATGLLGKAGPPSVPVCRASCGSWGSSSLPWAVSLVLCSAPVGLPLWLGAWLSTLLRRSKTCQIVDLSSRKSIGLETDEVLQAVVFGNAGNVLSLSSSCLPLKESCRGNTGDLCGDLSNPLYVVLRCKQCGIMCWHSYILVSFSGVRRSLNPTGDP